MRTVLARRVGGAEYAIPESFVTQFRRLGFKRFDPAPSHYPEIDRPRVRAELEEEIRSEIARGSAAKASLPSLSGASSAEPPRAHSPGAAPAVGDDAGRPLDTAPVAARPPPEEKPDTRQKVRFARR